MEINVVEMELLRATSVKLEDQAKYFDGTISEVRKVSSDPIYKLQGVITPGIYGPLVLDLTVYFQTKTTQKKFFRHMISVSYSGSVVMELGRTCSLQSGLTQSSSDPNRWTYNESIPFPIYQPGNYDILLYFDEPDYQASVSLTVIQAHNNSETAENYFDPLNNPGGNDLPYRIVDAQSAPRVCWLDKDKKLIFFEGGKPEFNRCPVCGYSWNGGLRCSGGILVESQAPCGHWVFC